MATLADLQAAESSTEAAVEVEAAVLPKNVVFDVELTKLGTDKARTRYFGSIDEAKASVLAYLPGNLPEALKGDTLDLSIAEATSKTKDGRSKVKWQQDTPEGVVLVLGYLPEAATHVESFTLNF